MRLSIIQFNEFLETLERAKENVDKRKREGK